MRVNINNVHSLTPIARGPDIGMCEELPARMCIAAAHTWLNLTVKDQRAALGCS